MECCFLCKKDVSNAPEKKKRLKLLGEASRIAREVLLAELGPGSTLDIFAESTGKHFCGSCVSLLTIILDLEQTQ